MHPIFRNTTSLGAYLAVWTVLAALLAALMRVPGDLTWSQALSVAVPLCLFYAFVCLTPWYLCRAFPLGKAGVARLLTNHLGAAILASALWIGLARLLGAILELGPELAPAIPQLVVVGLLLYLLSVALHYALLAVEASREAALQARDAELRALKSQINPHFLFNCLNSISALTSTDPARARDMCVLLSDFLRNTLGLGERASIPWREELDLARTYLEVEQVRFGARLQVEMQVDDACAECQVPPLVLQPLIENAIKHGIATMVDGGIVRLEGRIKDGRLAVRVENSFDPEAPSPRRHGLGLRNVRNRLETRFGDAAHLHVAAQNNRFSAEMVFPCYKTDQ
ncbi:MAG: periplasmic sensor signal transduction histidine kinase [Bryobacterales bacterium]|nr:periplasmic sensor signal transduction histidine kinase [Bryobacterales bacterium]